MKNQNSSSMASLAKLMNSQYQFLNLLSYFILFAFGLTLGAVLFSSVKDFSELKFQINNLSVWNSLQPAESNQSKLNNTDWLMEYLKPPPVMHNMDDEELLWRASMEPKIRKYPFERKPKVAFMFLTKGAVVMAPLWDKFFQGHDGLFTIYVHSSPSYNESVGSETEDSVFHGRRIPSKEVEWGNANMIEAERRLLANALLDISNERFVLLSESCIPLYNFTTIYSYLINSTQTHVESYDLPGPVGRGRYRDQMKPQIKGPQWRKGSQWFEIDRDLAHHVVSDQTYFPLFQKYCNGSCYADEHYLPTLLKVMKVGRKNSDRTLTWVDWSKGGPHPTRFVRTDVTVEFLRTVRGKDCWRNGESNKGCYLFARKFLPNALDRLLRFAPTALHFG